MRNVIGMLAALVSGCALVATAHAQQPAAKAVSNAKAAPAAAKAAPGHQVTVVIQRVRALDKIDQLSKADFLARVTIAGQSETVQRVREGDDISPNWRITKTVPPGRHDIRLEIFDKDLSKNEPIDINRLANKRHQDFTIDTRTCRISGFAGFPRCNTPIVRGGTKPKKAEVTFRVEVKK